MNRKRRTSSPWPDAAYPKAAEQADQFRRWTTGADLDELLDAWEARTWRHYGATYGLPRPLFAELTAVVAARIAGVGGRHAHRDMVYRTEGGRLRAEMTTTKTRMKNYHPMESK